MTQNPRLFLKTSLAVVKSSIITYYSNNKVYELVMTKKKK